MSKVIVITGGSSGLGKELATLFAKNGDNVLISGRDKEKLNKVAEEINAIPVPADVTKEEDMEYLKDKAVEDFGKIDIWINNAGTWLPHDFFENYPTERIIEVINTNLLGVILGCKYAVKQMKQQKNGYIINILSTSALQGRPKSAIYCGSKYGAVGFTKSIAAELKEFGINVSGVYPRGMKTNLFDESKPDDYNDYMNPKDVAQKIFELAQEENPEEELILKRENIIR